MDTEASSVLVDIPEKQLLDWLKSRNRISRKWNVALKQLREHIKSLLSSSLPQELQEKYSSWDNIYYFEVEDIVNFLKSRQEVTGRDWLGRSKDKRLRAWEEVLERYEKNNLVLAEAAQRMSQLTMFDIPQNKGEMVKQETSISNLTRRQGELRKKLEEATKDCQSFFEGLDMNPSLDIDLQLDQLKRKLPSLLREIVSALQSEHFIEVVNYHDSFISSLMPNRNLEDLSCLRLCISSDIKLYPENGSTFDASGLSLLEDTVQVLQKGQENVESSSLRTEPESSIDWGEEFISVQEHGQLMEGNDKESVEKNPFEEASSKFSLMNDEFRKSVEADILELKSFLEQRIRDTEEAVGNPLFTVFHQEIDSVEKNFFNDESKMDNLKEMWKRVNDVSDLFRGPVISRILLLRISRRYEERLKLSLQEKLQRIHKIESLVDTCERQKQESAKLLSEAEYHYRKSVDILHKWKKLVEDRLASQFPGSQFQILLDIRNVQ